MKQQFADTTELRKKLKELERHEGSNWMGFKGNGRTFIQLQEIIRPEIEMLKSFWDGNSVDNKKFYWWYCLPAYYDTPKEYLIYTSNDFGTSKYDVLHDRERYLESLQNQIFSLFHSWQFCTQGWTAYAY